MQGARGRRCALSNLFWVSYGLPPRKPASLIVTVLADAQALRRRPNALAETVVLYGNYEECSTWNIALRPTLNHPLQTMKSYSFNITLTEEQCAFIASGNWWQAGNTGETSLQIVAKAVQAAAEAEARKFERAFPDDTERSIKLFKIEVQP